MSELVVFCEIFDVLCFVPELHLIKKSEDFF